VLPVSRVIQLITPPSQSYLVRWIQVSAGNTISWSIQPHKKSLNFGVFKHPGGSVGLPTPTLPSISTFEPPLPANGEASTKSKGKLTGSSRNDNTTVIQKLESVGMKSVDWTGKCEADKVTMGKYDVVEGEGGMYGLVFDNTFSKQVSKTVTFVLMTYPTNAPPKSGHHLHFSQATAGSSPAALGPSPAPDGTADPPPHDLSSARPSPAVLTDPRPRSGHAMETKSFGGSTFYTGILNKRRRKHNTYARRFFSLDFTSSTLSYYQNRHSSALRGSIPLSLAVVGTNEKSREISIDSGAEVWHLKTGNQKDFFGWRDALDRASRVASSSMSPVETGEHGDSSIQQRVMNPFEEREWGRAEALVGKVSGIRDAVRRLAQDTDPKYVASSSSLGISNSNVGTPSPSESGSFEFFKESDGANDKLPFWKRKTSSNNASPAGLFRRSVSAQLAVPMPGGFPPSSNSLSVPKRQTSFRKAIEEEGVHEHCMAILQDLDLVVGEFSSLVSESKQRRQPLQSPLGRRNSGASVSSDEFFDAQDGDANRSQLLQIRNDSEDADDRDSISDGESDSSLEFEGIGSFSRKPREGQESLFPTKPKSLTPLPLDPVRRRKTVAPAKVPPPSLISFLRKNVGKDLSTIAMPVSANEPTSLLQRVAEQMEYSELLDTAAQAGSDAAIRLLNVTAFAISSFSGSRVKERAIRKPFNPMLGETFELIREDKGFRYIAEKVSHRPVRMACQAEASEWTFLQAPLPVQKFWGKSAELNTEGRARVFLHSHNEAYSWTLATSFLRNIIAGEKYIEPVSTMTVVNETSGAKAVATFKAGGMFAGRSEEVNVQMFDPQGLLLPTGMGGKWTSHLNITQQGSDTGKTVWSVGALVENPPQRYGFTAFAASLNEITSIEEGKLPPTDSRLRPDQRAAEDGDIDHAEALKAKLEERQRSRRRVMEEHEEEWIPKWFVKAGVDGDEEIWRLKSGKDNYWEERSRGDWSGVVDVFEA
jgi:hypothetical protein